MIGRKAIGTSARTGGGGRRRRTVVRIAALSLLAPLAAVPARGVDLPEADSVPPVMSRVSSPVLLQHLLRHPDQAGEALESRLEQLGDLPSTEAVPDGARRATPSGVRGLTRFNADVVGLPQNEESVSACQNRPSTVLGGTNDYRGLISPRGNFTGWHLSTDGGRTLANEGQLPGVELAGRIQPSQGDPVDVATTDCRWLYAASLNFTDPDDERPQRNGIGIYRTTPDALTSCPGGDAPSCWPVRRIVASNTQGHFLDKPWMTAGVSGAAGLTVWVVYTDFWDENPQFPDAFTNQIKAVRCNPDLTQCTEPILISGLQNSLQFGDVTIGPDGRVYVTWEADNDLANNFEPPENMTFWMRVAQPGSTSFGPPRRVARAALNLGIADLHANDFRVATYPKNTVSMVNGHSRVFVTWDECKLRVLGDTVCEEPQIKLRWSDNLGRTWSRTHVVSRSGDNFFPSIDTDPETGDVAVAYYSTRFDPVFHARQDVELVSVDADSGRVMQRHRVTPFSSDPEADPIVGGGFIGDYLEVEAQAGKAYVHFNANYVSVPLLGEGMPIPQQDNFLAVSRL